jgi:UDP-glucose 4-epimerase
MITTADKGNFVVILHTQQYNTKVLDFINKSNFRTSTVNPIKTFQNQIRKTINHSTALIIQNSKLKFVNLNPTAPTIKYLIKLHKSDQAIRPIGNWQNAPAFKLSKHFTAKLKQFSQLPYSFNIKNTTELIQELKQTPITPTFIFASQDSMNMYSNAPIIETKQILDEILNSNPTDSQIRIELLNWYDIITKQNYFQDYYSN